MKINVVSESQWAPTVWGGIHTAFVNNVKALQKNNVNFVVNSPGPADITHIHSQNIFGLYKILTSKRIVVTAHMTPQTQQGTFKMGRYGYGLTEKYLKFFYNKADLVIIFNKIMEKHLRAIGVSKPIVYIPNPIDTDMFVKNDALREKARKFYGFEKNTFVVVSAGHIVPRKGVVDFIKVARELPDITFVWAGSKLSSVIGADDDALEEALRMTPSNVVFVGRLKYEKMPEFYNMADALFFPSHHETFGMPITEAASCGIPLVLRDLPEYKELFDGHYIACRDNNDFKDALHKLSTDKEYYNKFSRVSLTLADKFSLERVGKLLKEQYDKLIPA